MAQDHSPEEIQRYCNLAIEEASKCDPQETFKVGAVVVQGRRWFTGHKGEGGSGRHAEDIAISKAKDAGIGLKRAVLYTTLEPCVNLEGDRESCCERIVDSKIKTVRIGEFDRNPRIRTKGKSFLKERGVRVLDFPDGPLQEVNRISGNKKLFTEGVGVKGRHRFDFTKNPDIRIAMHGGDDSPCWETHWSSYGPDEVQLHAGYEGVVAIAEGAKDFSDVDNPNIYYGELLGTPLRVGEIGIWRNNFGHVLLKVIDMHPGDRWGHQGDPFVTVEWEVRKYG